MSVSSLVRRCSVVTSLKLQLYAYKPFNFVRFLSGDKFVIGFSLMNKVSKLVKPLSASMFETLLLNTFNHVNLVKPLNGLKSVMLLTRKFKVVKFVMCLKGSISAFVRLKLPKFNSVRLVLYCTPFIVICVGAAGAVVVVARVVVVGGAVVVCLGVVVV